MVERNSFAFVLDCSITMAWCFEDEANEQTDKILERLGNSTSIVPSIWPLEVVNVLLIAARNKRITQVQASCFIDSLSTLPIIVDPSTSTRAMHSIFVLASQGKLSIYDAAYLELAIREKIPLATLDKELIKAAQKWDVPLLI